MVPVTFITYNRPETTKEAFACIRQAAPSVLYHVSDAAKKDDEVNAGKVSACREYVQSHIDWPCELHTVYAEENMGCRDRVASGITEVLSHEEMTIILEDDIVPAPEFFTYCEELLYRYKDAPRVRMISGCNLMRDFRMDTDYCFSCFPGIWGWATWARAWKDYDVDVADWPEVKASGQLKDVMGGFPYQVLCREIDSVYTKKKDTWDIQWDYCRHVHRGLGIVPRENLIRNIGFGEDATHTVWQSTEDFSYGTFTFPLTGPERIRRNVEYDRAYINKNYGIGRVNSFVQKRIQKLLGN